MMSLSTMKVAVARAICSCINRRLIGKGQFNSFSSEVKLTRCRLHSRSSRLESSRSTMGCLFMMLLLIPCDNAFYYLIPPW